MILCFVFSTLLLFIANVCFDVSSSSLMEKICERSLSTLIIKDVNNRFLLLELSYDLKRVFWARVMRFCRAANCTPSLSLKYIFNAMSYFTVGVVLAFSFGSFCSTTEVWGSHSTIGGTHLHSLLVQLTKDTRNGCKPLMCSVQ